MPKKEGAYLEPCIEEQRLLGENANVEHAMENEFCDSKE